MQPNVASASQVPSMQASDGAAAVPVPDVDVQLPPAQQSVAQPIDSQSSLPDNNTVTWAPLIVQVCCAE